MSRPVAVVDSPSTLGGLAESNTIQGNSAAGGAGVYLGQGGEVRSSIIASNRVLQLFRRRRLRVPDRHGVGLCPVIQPRGPMAAAFTGWAAAWPPTARSTAIRRTTMVRRLLGHEWHGRGRVPSSNNLARGSGGGIMAGKQRRDPSMRDRQQSSALVRRRVFVTGGAVIDACRVRGNIATKQRRGRRRRLLQPRGGGAELHEHREPRVPGGGLYLEFGRRGVELPRMEQLGRAVGRRRAGLPPAAC